jgi:DNA-binding FrmR family transcriptional regulator
MSRITQLAEMRALREEVDALKKALESQRECNSILLKHGTQHEARLAALENIVHTMLERLEALEAKRGPGRPKNDDRITARSN